MTIQLTSTDTRQIEQGLATRHERLRGEMAEVWCLCEGEVAPILREMVAIEATAEKFNTHLKRSLRVLRSGAHEHLMKEATR